MRRHAKAPSAASNSSTGLRSAIVTVAMSVVVLALFASPALGAITHNLEASFGSGEIGGSGGIAVDGTGNVYVNDWSAGNVRKYDASGSPSDFSALGSNTLGPFSFESVNQLAIDGSGGVNDGNLYVTNSYGGGIQAFKPSGEPANFSASADYISGNTLSGSPAGNFGDACGVTVDPNGTIYVGDYYTGVSIFAPSGQFLTSTPSRDVCNLAVDSVGALYVDSWAAGATRYTPSAFPVTASTTYSDPTEFPNGRVDGLAVDPADDNVYLGAGGLIAQYDSAANGSALRAEFGFGQVAEGSGGISIDRSGGANDGSVYVSGGGEVDRFSPALTVADLVAQDPTDLTPKTATLHGTISAAGGPAASCQFEYVSDADFQVNGFAGATTAPCDPAGPFTGSATEAVSAAVTGLEPGTTYHLRLYSTNADGSIGSAPVTFSTLAAVKVVSTGAATNLAAGQATLSGTIDPGGLAVSDCKFEYGLTEALGASVPCAESPGSIGSGEGPVSVHADLSGLDTDVYHFRLSATNAVGTTRGEDKTVAIPGLPIILKQSVSSESFRAVFKATIDPANSATSYRVEYGTTIGYGQSTEEGAISAGNDPVKVASEAKELSPSTTYHYRVVANNGIGETVGADQTFTTDAAVGSASCPNTPIRVEQGSIYLPECRAYEMVSPVDKLGGAVFNSSGLMFQSASPVAPDGSAAYFESQNSFGDAAATYISNSYVSRRGVNGWLTDSITNKGYLGLTSGDLDPGSFSRDFSKGIAFGDDASPGATPLAPGGIPNRRNLYLQDYLANTAVAVSLSGAPGTPPAGQPLFVGATPDFSMILFEDIYPYLANSPSAASPYLWHNGQLELVSILPSGDPAPDGAVIGGGQPFLGGPRARDNAISEDGSRIFFTTPDGRVYVRKNGMSTVEVSVSQKVVPDGHQAARYVGATPDGRYVFFYSEEQLLDSDTNSDKDLYRYDVDTDTLILVSVGGGFGYLAGLGDDGSHVYFTDGSTSLYLWNGGQVSFVATVAPTPDSNQSLRVTADGTAIAFMSGLEQQLTGEDPWPENESAPQAYLYNALTDTLTCASCRRDGGSSLGEVSMGFAKSESEYAFGGSNGADLHPLSNDGQRLFFETLDPLVSADTNEMIDVYEYVNGRQYLISTGLSGLESRFKNATPDGNSVFFTTVDPLVRRDGDQDIDLYVARVNGGFPEPPPEVPCTGEACRTGTTSPPNEPGAATPQFSGPGNANQRAAQKKAKKKKQKKKARNKKKAKKRASKSKGASKRSVDK